MRTSACRRARPSFLLSHESDSRPTGARYRNRPHTHSGPRAAIRAKWSASTLKAANGGLGFASSARHNPIRFSKDAGMHRFFAPALIVATSSAALGVGVPVGHIQLQDSYGSTNGGEFRAIGQGDFTVTPGRTGTAFQGPVAAAANLFGTFCVEKFEHIGFATSYAAAVNTTTDSTSSSYAGGAHGGFNDPLDAKTAYLYTHFINQNLLTAYDYATAANRTNDANALQTA